MPGVLEGIRVVDMGHVMAVPAAAAMLADWGAEVIKVEPLGGEMARKQKRVSGIDRVIAFDKGEVNWMVELANRNKKSIAVNLKTQAGREIVYKLVSRADIFMTNYLQSALQQLKMDYLSLRQINENIIYGLLTGYGSEGPYKDRRGFADSAWAFSGAMYLTGDPGRPLGKTRPGVIDRIASSNIASGILGALVHKQRTGKGQMLETSLYQSAVWAFAGDFQAALVNRPLPVVEGAGDVGNPLYNTYRAKDQSWFMLTMLQDDDWPHLCRAVGRPELEHDARFATGKDRQSNAATLIGILEETFMSRDFDEWEVRFEENNCIYAPVQSAVEVANDPQALANSFFVDVAHPIAEQMRLVNSPVRFHQNPSSISKSAPTLGEHTEEILADLGFDEPHVRRLKEEGVILDR